MEIKSLISSLQLVRLYKDLEFIEKGISDNVQVEKSDKDNIFKKFSKNVSNSIKKNRCESFEKDKSVDLKRIEELKEDKEITVDISKVKEVLNSYCKTIEKKYVLGIIYLLSDTNEYSFKDETDKELSKIIFDDENKLEELKKSLNSHYLKVSDGVLTSLFTGFKSNEIVLAALTEYMSFDVKGKTAFEGCEKAFLSLNDESENSARAILSFLLTGKLSYSESDNSEAINAFLKLNKIELQNALAIKACLISLTKSLVKDNELKDNVKTLLTSLSILSLNCQLNMIVEKKDEENSKDKLASINAFIDDIASILK